MLLSKTKRKHSQTIADAFQVRNKRSKPKPKPKPRKQQVEVNVEAAIHAYHGRRALSIIEEDNTRRVHQITLPGGCGDHMHGPTHGDHSEAKAHWHGYFQVKATKIREQFRPNAPVTEPKLQRLFRGVTVYCNGYMGVDYSAHALANLIRSHGGNVTPYLSRTQCTHVLASRLSGAKAEQERSRQGGRHGKLHTVTPSWVTASITAKKRLPERNFSIIKPQGSTLSSFFSTS